jgi:hypothetical protein
MLWPESVRTSVRSSVRHDNDGFLIIQEPLNIEQLFKQLKRGNILLSTIENHTRKFDTVQILEVSKGTTPSRKCKNLTLKWNCSSTVRDKTTNTVDHYRKVVHCLSNGTKFSHVSLSLPRKFGVWFAPEFSFFHWVRFLMHTSVQSCRANP